jgi:hypothetical protein
MNKRKSQNRVNRRLSLPVGGDEAIKEALKEDKTRKEKREKSQDVKGESEHEQVSAKTKAEIVLFDIDATGYALVHERVNE